MPRAITLDDLIDAVPEQFKEIIMEYGPALLKMAGEEFKKWLQSIIKGNTMEAYRILVSQFDGDEKLDELNSLEDAWQDANEANAESIELQKAAATAIMKALLTAVIGILI